MKNTTALWVNLIKSRQSVRDTKDITLFFVDTIKAIANDYTSHQLTEAESVVFMENIGHVFNLEMIEFFSGHRLEQVEKRINEETLKHFFNLVAYASVTYKKAGHEVRWLQVSTVNLLLKQRFADMIDLDRHRHHAYLKGTRKTFKFKEKELDELRT